MIILMVKDMLVFLLLLAVFYAGISLAIYYVISGDLSETSGGLGSLGSIGEYGMQAILGAHEWEATYSYRNDTSGERFSPTRSRIVQFWLVVTAILGTIVLLNLLVAMLATRYSEAMETAQLEVNFLRVEESYNASQSGVLIPPPLIFFAFMLMGLWLALDFAVGIFTQGRKMIDDWYFSPLNKKVLRPGDEIDYKALEWNETTKQYEPRVKTGYVYKLKCSEVGVMQNERGGEGVEVTPRQIEKIHKSFITNRSAEVGKMWHSVARHYCKYCRFEFLTDNVGSSTQIARLFRRYGKQLDPDDLGKLSNQLGEHLEINTNPEMKTLDVAQLCPQCYRPFFASPDRSDELGRFMFLAEAASLWVFFCVMFLPLAAAMAVPALLSFIYASVEELTGQSGSQGASTNDLGAGGSDSVRIFSAKSDYELALGMSHQTIDKYRENVRRVLAEELTHDQRVAQLRRRVEDIREQIHENVLEYEINNIPYRCQQRLRKNESWKNPEVRKRRFKKLVAARSHLRHDLQTLKDMLRKIQTTFDAQLVSKQPKSHTGPGASVGLLDDDRLRSPKGKKESGAPTRAADASDGIFSMPVVTASATRQADKPKVVDDGKAADLADLAEAEFDDL
jgi:hypothetical protein